MTAASRHQEVTEMLRPLGRTHVVVGALAAGLAVVLLAACTGPDLPEEPEDLATGLDADEFDSGAFADEFPMHFDSYVENQEREGQRQPKIVEGVEPDLPMLWSNLLFSVSYEFPRPHLFGVQDVIETPRMTEDGIGSCLTCKSTTVPTLIDEMGEDYWSASFQDEIQPRVEELAAEAEGHEDLDELQHVGIGCSDCHDPTTMDLQINRPSFTNAMDRRGIDHVAEATHNDMRSDVCGQCHVNYYFHPETSKVTFPWDEGLRPEDQLEFMQTTARDGGFEADWIHGVSGSPMLKTQHPEYEMWTYGTHGEAGVSCTDCHMPAERVGGEKMTTHNLQSPMTNDETLERSCGQCHADRSAEELRGRVEAIQTSTLDAKADAQRTSVEAHYHVNRMITAGADLDRIEEAQELIREGQFYWDFIAASNGDGFHNHGGSLDTLRKSTDLSNDAIKIATEELASLDVDLDELRTEIASVIDDVHSEEEPSEKHTLVTNEFFPDVSDFQDDPEGVQESVLR